MLAQRYGCIATCNAVCTLMQLLADMLNPTKSVQVQRAIQDRCHCVQQSAGNATSLKVVHTSHCDCTWQGRVDYGLSYECIASC